jgi:hypothetical protein
VLIFFGEDRTSGVVEVRRSRSGWCACLGQRPRCRNWCGGSGGSWRVGCRGAIFVTVFLDLFVSEVFKHVCDSIRFGKLYSLAVGPSVSRVVLQITVSYTKSEKKSELLGRS